MIDKAVIQGERPLMVEGGGAVPPEVARLLTRQTADAIRENNPALIDQEGVRALPAPTARAGQGMGSAGSATAVPLEVEIVEEEAPAAGSAAYGASSSANLPVRREGAVVPRETLPERSTGGDIARALVRGAGFALSKAGQLAHHALAHHEAVEPQAKPAGDSEEDRYATCKFCGTEVLRSDNYCYHCGVLLRGEAAQSSIRIQQPRQSTLGILVFSVLLMAALVYIKKGMPQLSSALSFLPPALAILSLLLLVGAFFRKRTILNQFLVIVLLVAWLAALYVAFRSSAA
jgi:hypothetical protein